MPRHQDSAGLDFGELVRDALKNLHDLAYLQTHALTAFVRSDKNAASTLAGRLLARQLREAIEALHRDFEPRVSAEGERRYRLLSLRYLEGLAPAQAQQELSISRSTYQREHGTALAALSSLLSEQWKLSEPWKRSQPGDTPAGRTLVVAHSSVRSGRDRAGGVDRPGDLPLSLTSLIGREDDVLAVIQRVDSGRLVTLTGPPGIGKTRLALEVAARLTSDYRDGIFFVSLASIRDPGLVPSSIARALGIQELPGRTLLEALAHDLQDRHVLIILDNFEQLLPSAPVVANLLASAPQLRALVTSRAPLHVRGEIVFQLQPLELPVLPVSDKEAVEVGPASRYAAVQLFVERARAANSDFELTDTNVSDVVDICRRVDGLPLALELAAARSRILSPGAIRVRLENRLRFLTSGQRDLPARQQALRSAIDWSYDLLDDDAQLLFRRLAIFVGGCSLEVAEVVCAEPDRPDLDVLGRITSLADHSLLLRETQPGGEPRFRMLESIREYALERLAESGEGDELGNRFAAYFGALGGLASSSFLALDQSTLLRRLDAEHDNVRAVLRRLTEREDASAGLDLVGALAWYWLSRNYWTEGRGWLRRVLALSGAGTRSLPRANALLGAGILAVAQGDFNATRGFLVESTAIFREQGEKRGLALGLGALASVSVRNRERTARQLVLESLALFCELGEKSRVASMSMQLGAALIHEREYPAARNALLESLTIWQEFGERSWIAEATRRLGELALREGEFDRSRGLFQESLSIYRSLASRDGIAKQGIAVVLNLLGEQSQREGDSVVALSLHDESAAIARELGDTDSLAAALRDLGRVKRHLGDAVGAVESFHESLQLRQRQGHLWGVLAILQEIAESALELGETRRAVRIYAVADRMLRVDGVLNVADEPFADHPTQVRRNLATARAALGEETFADQWAIGGEMTLAQGVTDALRPFTTAHR